MATMRDIARQSSITRKSWFGGLTCDQRDELADLWQGAKVGEYSQTVAWRIWCDTYPNNKISRSAFSAKCTEEFNQ